jgi:ribonuclease HII
VVAAAVILAPRARLPGIDDSKRLDAAERELLAGAIERQARSTAIRAVEPAEIDRLGIRTATLVAMRQSLAALDVQPDLVLVDGRDRIPDWPHAQEAVIRGDGQSLAIACASVIAKVFRDRLMVEFDRRYPGYGFARHKGYGTAEHLAALERLGPSPIHRRSFAPVREAAQMVLL